MRTLYRVKRGQHYARPLSLRLHWKRQLFSYKIKLSTLNMYEYVAGSPKSEQINKLVGFTDGLFRHNNEFRLGWRCNDMGKADLFCYFYKDSVRPSLGEIESDYHLGTVELGESFLFTLEKFKNKVVFKLKCKKSHHKAEIHIDHKRRHNYGWLLRPYNGGRETYDNDFYFEVDEFKKRHISS